MPKVLFFKKNGFTSSSCLHVLPLHHMLCFPEMAFTLPLPSRQKVVRLQGEEGSTMQSLLYFDAIYFYVKTFPISLDSPGRGEGNLKQKDFIRGKGCVGKIGRSQRRF